jgi:hypothetical protein
MRAATAVEATAILILMAEVWACAAGTEDSIKPGTWEYWIVGSKIPEPPPGAPLPPSMRRGPEGMINSWCISVTPAPHARTSVPVDEKGSCDFDTTTDANAATFSWSMNCAWSSGSKSKTEGVVHFHDDTLDGTTTLRHSFPNLSTQEYFIPYKGPLSRPVRPQVSRRSGRWLIAGNATGIESPKTAVSARFTR